MGAGASSVASPSPTPEASPQASPASEESANSRGAQEGGKGKREERAPVRTARKPARGNPVVRTLKKIFKNPF
jgi:hypothetical protein